MRRLVAALLVALLVPHAHADQPVVFDYYLLALSWTPSWCEAEGDDHDAPACAPGAGVGFILHGLWPQYEEGWPEFCETDAGKPTPADIEAMAEVMGSAGLAWYQWTKHGSCSGLDAATYFERARRAFAAVELPEVSLYGTTAEAALLADAVRALNPAIPEDGLIVTCREGLAREFRLCLQRDLAPRPCAADVLARACPPDLQVTLPPPR